jgi:hypothetical protein
MSSLSTARFRKLRTCPRSETLLTFCLGARNAAQSGDRVAEHIESCEFCGAEVQLLSRYAPPADALPFAALALPASLRRLAEDLLVEPPYNRARYAELLHEIERLTLTDA